MTSLPSESTPLFAALGQIIGYGLAHLCHCRGIAAVGCQDYASRRDRRSRVEKLLVSSSRKPYIFCSFAVGESMFQS